MVVAYCYPLPPHARQMKARFAPRARLFARVRLRHHGHEYVLTRGCHRLFFARHEQRSYTDCH